MRSRIALLLVSVLGLGACLIVACSVSVNTADDGSTQVEFTIGGKTFAVTLGDEAVFDIETSGATVEKVFSITLFTETPVDEPAGASMVIEAASVEFIPAEGEAKANLQMQNSDLVIELETYIAGASTMNPCDQGIFLGTSRYTFDREGRMSADGVDNEFELPDEALEAMRLGLVNLCLRATSSTRGRIRVREVLFTFEHPDGTTIYDGNVNDNTADNENDNAVDNENDNAVDNVNDNTSGDAVGAEALAGCWRVAIDVDSLDLEDEATLEAFIYEIDASGDLDKLWIEMKLIESGETVIVEYVRFAGTNTGLIGSEVLETYQDVSVDGTADLFLSFETDNGEKLTLIDILDAELSGDPPSSFTSQRVDGFVRSGDEAPEATFGPPAIGTLLTACPNTSNSAVFGQEEVTIEDCGSGVELMMPLILVGFVYRRLR